MLAHGTVVGGRFEVVEPVGTDHLGVLLAAKDHVTVFLYDGGLAPDPEGIITGGHGNETGRFIAIRENEPINRPAMLALFRAIIANNRAGGWRKLKNGA